jgi:hypothetical protein
LSIQLLALRPAQAALNATVPPVTTQAFTNTVANAVGQPSTSVSGSLSGLQVALQRVMDNPTDPIAWLNFLWILAGFLPLAIRGIEHNSVHPRARGAQSNRNKCLTGINEQNLATDRGQYCGPLEDAHQL